MTRRNMYPAVSKCRVETHGKRVYVTLHSAVRGRIIPIYPQTCGHLLACSFSITETEQIDEFERFWIRYTETIWDVNKLELYSRIPILLIDTFMK